MKIDENYSIQTDDNNCTLVFSEQRTREKKDDTTEEYTFEDRWYYPTVYHCLKRYLQLAQKEAKDVEDCIRLTEETFKKLKGSCG